MAFTEIVLRVPLAVIVEKFCPAILRRGMPPPSLARILARVNPYVPPPPTTPKIIFYEEMKLIGIQSKI